MAKMAGQKSGNSFGMIKAYLENSYWGNNEKRGEVGGGRKRERKKKTY